MGHWPVPATGSVAGSVSDPPGEPPGFTAEPAVLPELQLVAFFRDQNIQRTSGSAFGPESATTIDLRSSGRIDNPADMFHAS